MLSDLFPSRHAKIHARVLVLSFLQSSTDNVEGARIGHSLNTSRRAVLDKAICLLTCQRFMNPRNERHRPTVPRLVHLVLAVESIDGRASFNTGTQIVRDDAHQVTSGNLISLTVFAR